MTTWRDGGLVGFALESTGPRDTDTVTGAALLTWKPGEGLDVATWASAPLGVVDRLVQAVKAHTPIVGHNVAQALTLLEANCRAHGVQTLSDRLGGHGEVRPIIDTWVIGAHLRPDLPHHSLEALTRVYDVRTEGTSLEATAKAAMRLAWALHGKHKEIQTDARTLHALEGRWFLPELTRAAARAGRHGDVDTSLRWPVRPPVEVVPEPEGFVMPISYDLAPDEAAAIEALRAAGFTPELIGTTERIS
jgi:DNA polymerase-3 subunit epsilon